MHQLILASHSPRRRDLMHCITDEFTCVSSDAEEKTALPEGLRARQIPVRLARIKARDVASRFQDAIVIGCDTIVIGPDGIVYGKPKNKKDAERILSVLSGATHHVVTGVCLRFEPSSGIVREKVFSEVTKVTFYPLTTGQIRRYIESGEPMDKAGAYGIQGRGALLVRRVEGDFYNVMGLPVARLYRELEAFEEIL